VKRVGLVMHGERAEAVVIGRELADALVARGIEVHAAPSDAARIAHSDVVAAETFPEGLDLVFVLGGDGTLLRAAQVVADHGIPLLGVNLGRLGFLTEVERGEVQTGLLRILDDGFTIEERSVLHGEIREAGSTTTVWALNDVIIEKVDIGRAIRLAVSIGGEPFVSWYTDGLIVSTATGSTAYSFSAGGPVVSPRLDLMLVTPVAPHGLFDRTIVVPPDEEVLVRLLPEQEKGALSADGRPGLPLSSGAEVRVRIGGRIKLAKVEPAPFWRLVREKFGLPPA